MQQSTGGERKENPAPSRRASLVERVAEQLGDEMNTAPAEVVTVPLMDESAVDAPLFDGDQDRGQDVEPKAPCLRSKIDMASLKTQGFINPESVRTRKLEEFRIIKRSILQNVAERQQHGLSNPNVVMVTSTRPEEGKTFAAINLALSIALEPDHSVLLVDADVIKPRIARTLGLEAEQGLLDLLQDPAMNPSDVTIRTDIEGLSVLPALGSNQMSTELLASRRMSQIVRQMASEDPDRIVIFDTPPVLSTSEPAALAGHVGQIIFAVEAERTTRGSIQEALDLLGPHNNIGFVLNKAKRQFGSVYFGSYYADSGKHAKELKKVRKAKA